MLAKVGKHINGGLFWCLIGALVYFCGCAPSEEASERGEIDTYRQINVLDQQRQSLEQKEQEQKDQIRKLAEEYGAGHLSSRLEIQLQRVGALMQELVKVEASRTKLEAEIEVLEAISDKSAEQQQGLAQAQVELRKAQAYESRMRDMVAKEDAEAVELGRRQLAIGDLKEQLQSTQKQKDQLSERIKVLELQQSNTKKKWPW